MDNDKLKMQSPDMVNQNFEKLAELFPNCVTESASGKSIDFDSLKQELNHAVVEGNKERYRLEWPGKREAIVTANLPTNKTLRPVREDSVDFDNTENIYIEGDNLEVLKLLQESYLGKIKMIYIDPPYNTGNDFVYKDNFAKDKDEELFESGQKDELSQRLVVNHETSGRYHSDWLSMMYPRLKLARNLLKDDGVIFISIDDNEVNNLKRICDEIFGEQQFQAQIIPVVNPGGRDYKQVAVTNEYLLVYSKSQELILNEIPKDIEFKFFDTKGGYELRELRNRNPKFHSGNRPNLFYGFYANAKSLKDGYCTVSLQKDSDHTIEIKPYNSQGKESVWRWGKEKAQKSIFDGNHDQSQILAKQKSDGNWNIYEKNRRTTTKVKSIWDETEMRTENGTRSIRSLFDSTPFDHPKPVDLIKRCIQIGTNDGDLILDFFSGSATTAHSVFQINSELDDEKRSFILIQLNESTSINSEAYQLDFKNICEIGKERIRRAAKKIEEETKADIDYGFRVYCLDESNMQDVYYRPQDFDQAKMDLFADNVKEGRTEDDLLAQVMLDWGLPLSLKIEQASITGKKVFKVAENALFACFDSNIDEAFAKEIAKEHPLRIVFKDAGFKDDTAKTNVKQLLKQLTPETEMKVL